MRILVLGSSGMLGHIVYEYLESQGHEVMGVSRTRIEGINSVEFDVLKDPELFDFIDKDKPAVIINCIGLLIKESEENHVNAIFINSLLPHMLSRHIRNKDIKLIHISTDCVFDGDMGPYIESSLPTETNWYGRTKSLGELNNSKDLTIRTSIIGPDLDENGSGLFNWFSKQKGSVSGYVHVFWNGVTTLECAKEINRIITKQPDLSGLVHLTSPKEISKYHLLKLIKKVFSKFTIKVVPGTEPNSSKVLFNTREDYSPKISSYEKQLKELKEFIK